MLYYTNHKFRGCIEGLDEFEDISHIIGSKYAISISDESESHCVIPTIISTPVGFVEYKAKGLKYAVLNLTTDEYFAYGDKIYQLIEWEDPNVNVNLTKGYLTPIACAFPNIHNVRVSCEEFDVIENKLIIKCNFKTKTVEIDMGQFTVNIIEHDPPKVSLPSRFGIDKHYNEILPVNSLSGLRNLHINFQQMARRITKFFLITHPVTFKFSYDTDYEIHGLIMNSEKTRDVDTMKREWKVQHKRPMYKHYGNNSDGFIKLGSTAREIYSKNRNDDLEIMYQDENFTESIDVNESDVFYYTKNGIYGGIRLRYPLTIHAYLSTTGPFECNLKEIFGDEEPTFVDFGNLNGFTLNGVLKPENSPITITINYAYCETYITFTYETILRSNEKEFSYVAYCAKFSKVTTVEFFTDQTLTYEVNTGNLKTFQNSVSIPNISEETILKATCDDSDGKITIVLKVLEYSPQNNVFVIPFETPTKIDGLSFTEEITGVLKIEGIGENLVKGENSFVRTSNNSPDQLALYEPDSSSDYTEKFEITQNGVVITLKSTLISSLVLSRLFAILYKNKICEQISFTTAPLENPTVPITLVFYADNPILSKSTTIRNGVCFPNFSFSSDAEEDVLVYSGTSFIRFKVCVLRYTPQQNSKYVIRENINFPNTKIYGEKIVIHRPIDSIVTNVNTTFTEILNDYDDYKNIFEIPEKIEDTITLTDSVPLMEVNFINIAMSSENEYYLVEENNLYKLYFRNIPIMNTGKLKTIQEKVYSLDEMNSDTLTYYYVHDECDCIVINGDSIMNYVIKGKPIRNVKCNLGIPFSLITSDSIQNNDVCLSSGMCTVFNSDVSYLILSDVRCLMSIDKSPYTVNVTTYNCMYDPIKDDFSETDVESPYYSVCAKTLSVKTAYSLIMRNSTFRNSIKLNQRCRYLNSFIVVNQELLEYAHNVIVALRFSDDTTYLLSQNARHCELFGHGGILTKPNVVWTTLEKYNNEIILEKGGLRYYYAYVDGIVYARFITSISFKTTKPLLSVNGLYKATDILTPVLNDSEPGEYIVLPTLHKYEVS